MERIFNSNLPPNISVYRLDDGRLFRIVLVLVTPTAELPTASSIEVETRGYEVDENGNFVIDANMEPITIKPQRARIPLGNVRDGLDSVRPGWVYANIDDPRAFDALQVCDALPDTGIQDQVIRLGDSAYRYTDGLYEQVRRARVADLATAPAPLDPGLLAP